MSFIVAIDGPAGSGKGTVTEIVSKKLNLTNIGSGAAYRCVALATIENNINISDTNKIIDLLDKINIEYKKENDKDLIYLNGIDVTKRIRESDVAKIVSQVSSIKEVRFKLNDIFRAQAKSQDVIMEGRDIGTYVFPNAEVKIYLDADVEERARRRYKENKEKGIEMSYEEVLENIKKRDENDKNKKIGALKIAEGAIIVDTTSKTIKEVADEIENIIKLHIRKD